MVDLKLRTKRYALQIINLYCKLPKSDIGKILGKQMLRSGTSVGANYREATRARSTREFCSKANISLQELDETGYWLELISESGTISAPEAQSAWDETSELTAIFVTMIKNAKAKRSRPSI
ncbi:four helix bundle protein [candidate division TA06 bacterium]|uniref:Four helix bundle protein n=1 Tax=candidate division TA06 bacterium TaxID=2250710 RepID=A0A933IDR6_UNCT6|nr:four helix bundle protein [candidate division TA06 bacterium]